MDTPLHTPGYAPLRTTPTLVVLILLTPLLLTPLLPGSSAGAQEWSAVFGGVQPDFGSGVVPTPDGGAVAVGSTNRLDAYVVRVDAAGTLLWQRTLSLSQLSEQAYSVLPTDDGGFVVIASADTPSTVDYRPWLVKLDAQGQTVWSTAQTITETLPVDSGLVRGARLLGGDIVVAGGANTMTNPEDPWVLRVDAHGELIDFDVYPTLGTPGFGVATSIDDVRATADGGFVLTGTVSGGLGQAYLWKFDAHGAPEWNRLYDAEGFRAALAVLPIADGYLAVGCDLPNCNHTTVLRTDAHGVPQWLRTAVDPDGLHSIGRDVIVRQDGAFLVLQNRFTAAGSRAFRSDVLALAGDGTPLERRTLPGGTGSTALWRLESAAGGAFVATGNVAAAGALSDPDLYVLRADDGSDALFTDGFEDGTMGRWAGSWGD